MDKFQEEARRQLQDFALEYLNLLEQFKKPSKESDKEEIRLIDIYTKALSQAYKTGVLELIGPMEAPSSKTKYTERLGKTKAFYRNQFRVELLTKLRTKLINESEE